MNFFSLKVNSTNVGYTDVTAMLQNAWLMYLIVKTFNLLQAVSSYIMCQV